MRAGGPAFRRAGGGMYADEIDPQDLFNMFFGGGMGSGECSGCQSCCSRSEAGDCEADLRIGAIFVLRQALPAGQRSTLAALEFDSKRSSAVRPRRDVAKQGRPKMRPSSFN